MKEKEKTLLEELENLIANAANPVRFYPGGVPVRVAAAVYGKSATFVQEGLRAGWLTIGHYVPGHQRDNFYVSPKKLYEDTGFFYTGQTLEEIEKLREAIGRKK